MRAPLSALASVALAGCSLVLDDPTPFQAEPPEAGVDMAPVAADMDPDGEAPRLDAAPLDMAVLPPDMAPPPADMAPPPADMAPPPEDMAVDRGPQCSDEVCDGRDNDCDGEFDETFPGQCEPCGVAGGRGLCARGAKFCVQGGIQCVPWLPEPADVVDCDLHDNDCDGTVDEFDERNASRSATGDRVVAVCGGPDSVVAAPGEGCGVAPRVVGCAEAHACVPANCRVRCWDDLQTLQATCDEACAGPAGDALDACLQRVTDCHAVVRADFEACVAECPAGTASTWSCQNGQGGPVCSAVNCPEGTTPEGRECVPDD